MAKKRRKKREHSYFALGGEVEGVVDPSNAAMINAILARNGNKNFVNRILNPDPTLSIPDPNEFGKTMSHKMAYSGIDNGRAIAYPTIIQDGVRSLQQLGGDEAVDYAFKTKQAISFPNEQSAKWFTENYKTPEFQKTYAMGGKVTGKRSLSQHLGPKVPIEVEGQEVIQTPDGSVAKVSGPSHASGGVQMEVPVGTDIFSKRISVDGKTIAERKAIRERYKNKVSKLFDTNPTDRINKNTMERAITTTQVDDDMDMNIQRLAAPVLEPEKFALGGTAGLKYTDPGAPRKIDPITGLYVDPDYSTLFNDNDTLFPKSTPEQILDSPDYFTPKPALNETDAFRLNADLQQASKTTDPLVDPSTGGASTVNTLGNAVGTIGTVFGAVAPLLNTLNNREGDTPNINPFRDFGRDALDTNREEEDYLAVQQQAAQEAMAMNVNAAKMRNRNSASSISTQRALDSITDIGANQATGEMRSKFANQFSNILGRRSGLQNQSDMYRMQGEGQRDQADRADRDAFYTNLGQNLSGIGDTVQVLGKNMNATQEQQDMVDLMSEMSKYGMEVKRRGGKMRVTKTKNK